MYTVKMRNPKTGKVEQYTTNTTDEHELALGLELFESVGYVIIETAKE